MLGMIAGATLPLALWALRSPASRKAAMSAMKKVGKWPGEHPKISGAATVVGGGLGGAYLENLLRDEEEEQTTLGPGSASAVGGGVGMPPVADDFPLLYRDMR